MELNALKSDLSLANSDDVVVKRVSFYNKVKRLNRMLAATTSRHESAGRGQRT